VFDVATGVRGTRFRTRADSIASVTTRAAAERAAGLRVVVSIGDRELHVLRGSDTLRVAPVAVASDTTLEFDGRRWTFTTPRGRRVVLAKRRDPVWTPPDWHYAEVARNRGLRLATLSTRRPTVLADGRQLVVRGGRVGIVEPGWDFVPLPADEEIIFDSTVFVPPLGTRNRRIPASWAATCSTWATATCSTARRTRRPSAPRPRTAASGCATRTSSGCTRTSRWARASTSTDRRRFASASPALGSAQPQIPQ
jgi:hypothetical protein